MNSLKNSNRHHFFSFFLFPFFPQKLFKMQFCSRKLASNPFNFISKKNSRENAAEIQFYPSFRLYFNVVQQAALPLGSSCKHSNNHKITDYSEQERDPQGASKSNSRPCTAQPQESGGTFQTPGVLFSQTVKVNTQLQQPRFVQA